MKNRNPFFYSQTKSKFIVPYFWATVGSVLFFVLCVLEIIFRIAEVQTSFIDLISILAGLVGGWVGLYNLGTWVQNRTDIFPKG